MSDIADNAEAIEAQQRADALDGMRRTRQAQMMRRSLSACEDCDMPIPDERQKAVPGVRRCIECQSRFEQQQQRGLA